MKTYEEALKEAKLEAIMCGGCDKIKSEGGKWFDAKTGKPLTQAEGLALVEVDPKYVAELMRQI